MNYSIWVLILLSCAATKCSVRQCFYALFTLRCKIETSFGFLLQLFYTNGGKENRYSVFQLQIMLKKVSSFYVCSICLRNLLFKLKRMKMNVKQKAGFRWKCVLKSMFILLFTRINNEQSSIVSKISIYLATHATIYFIRQVEFSFLNNKKFTMQI